MCWWQWRQRLLHTSCVTRRRLLDTFILQYPSGALSLSYPRMPNKHRIENTTFNRHGWWKAAFKICFYLYSVSSGEDLQKSLLNNLRSSHLFSFYLWTLYHSCPLVVFPSLLLSHQDGYPQLLYSVTMRNSGKKEVPPIQNCFLL